MKKLKTLLASLLLCFSLLSAPYALAADSILPEAGDNCGEYLSPGYDENELKEIFRNSDEEREDILGCAIQYGKVKFWMIPFFVSGVLEFIIGLAGMISVLMILVGAYYYIGGGISDDKEKGKTVVTYAIGGLVLTIISWFLVNVLLLALTS